MRLDDHVPDRLYGSLSGRVALAVLAVAIVGVLLVAAGVVAAGASVWGAISPFGPPTAGGSSGGVADEPRPTTSSSEDIPTTEFRYRYDAEEEAVTVAHAGGERIRNASLLINVSEPGYDHSVQFSRHGGWLTEGDSATVEVDPGDTIEIAYYDSAGKVRILDTYRVPGSDATSPGANESTGRSPAVGRTTPPRGAIAHDIVPSGR